MRTQPARFQSEQSEFSRELGVWTGGGITLLSVDSDAGPVRGAGACKGWEAPLPACLGGAERDGSSADVPVWQG